MVRKIDQLLLNGGCGCHPPPPPAPSLGLILEPRRQVRSEKMFMDRCPKDKPTGKNLVCKKALQFLRKIGKPVRGGGGLASTLPLTSEG